MLRIQTFGNAKENKIDFKIKLSENEVSFYISKSHDLYLYEGSELRIFLHPKAYII